MGINIITGRQSQVLSSIIYNEIGKTLKKGKDGLFLIVPEQYTLGAEEALIQTQNLKGLLGVEVLSIKRLGNRILHETGGLTKTFMDAHGKSMLLQKTFNEIQKELTVYAASVKKPGFLISMSDLITEFKQNEITPKVLKTSIETLETGMTTQKLEDIYKIYAHFMKAMGENRLDQEDLQQLICKQMFSADFLRRKNFWFDGFQNFSEQDYRLIRGLVTLGESVSFALTLDFQEKEGEIFRVTKDTYYKIKNIGGEAMVDFMVKEIPYENCRSQTLQHLEKNGFGFPRDILEVPVKDIILTQCQNIWEEVEKGAQKIVDLVRDKGFSYHDIVVSTGAMEDYGSVIKRVFRQYNIPFFMDDLRNIGNNHLIEGIMSILETILGYYRFNDIFGFIKTGFGPIHFEESEDLENYALEFGIRGSQWEREFTKVSENEDINLEELNACRERLITPISKLREEMKGKVSCESRTKILYDFLEDIHTLEKINALTEKLFLEEDYENFEIYKQIWNILMAVFDQIVETMGDEEVSLEEYTAILKSGFQGYQLGVIPSQREVVNITDLRRSRSGSIKVLMVFGLNEGIIPGLGSEPNLITDAERRILLEHHLFLQNNREFQMNQENFLVHELFSKPEKLLYLYWSLTDLEGSSQQPSILVNQITGIFPKLKIRSTLHEGLSCTWDKISTPTSTFEHLSHFLKDMKSKNKGNFDENEVMIWRSAEAWYESQSSYKEDLEGLNKALGYKGLEDEILPNEALKLYGRKMETSISRLETYRKCPFSHFVKYGLKPKGRPMYEIKNLEIGNLLHEVMEGFFETVEKREIDLTKASKELTHGIVEELIEVKLPQIKSNVFNSTGQYQYLGKKVERIGKKSVDMMIAHLMSGGFTPKYHELEFKKEICIPQELRGMNLETLRIRGKIDRLDLYEKEGKTWVKIVDYKTGLKKLSYSEIYYGLSLQLIIYLDGAIHEIQGEHVLPGGTFYFHLDDPLPKLELNKSVEAEINKAFDLNGLLLDDPEMIEGMAFEGEKAMPITNISESKLTLEEFEILIDYVRKTVVQQVSQIYQGDIRIKPYDRKEAGRGCDYCEYHGICQFDEDIRRTGYEIMKKTIKKNEFFNLIKEQDHELD
ncbi:MAG: PD-(D/E)XK nuclease family protein [Eubacteriaceae bacterium]